MRFLVDECTGSKVAEWLRDENHEIFSVFDEARGMTDDEILVKAFSENWVLITNDKDFGEMVFRERRRHHGVVFMRLDDEEQQTKLKFYGDCSKVMLRNFLKSLLSLPKRKCVLPQSNLLVNAPSNKLLDVRAKQRLSYRVVFLP